MVFRSCKRSSPAHRAQRGGDEFVGVALAQEDLTTNLAVDDWPTIFPAATCATALIDRTVHHADVVAIEGDSYRRRDAETDKKSRRAKKQAA